MHVLETSAVVAKGSPRTEEEPCSVTISLPSSMKLFSATMPFLVVLQKRTGVPRGHRGRERKGWQEVSPTSPQDFCQNIPEGQKTLSFLGKAGENLWKDNSIKTQYQTYGYNLSLALIVYICGSNTTTFFL